MCEREGAVALAQSMMLRFSADGVGFPAGKSMAQVGDPWLQSIDVGVHLTKTARLVSRVVRAWTLPVLSRLVQSTGTA